MRGDRITHRLMFALTGAMAASPSRAGAPFAPPERVLPVRPSSPTAEASAEVLIGAEAVVAPTSWFTPVVILALAMIVALTAFATWRAGRAHRPGPPPGHTAQDLPLDARGEAVLRVRHRRCDRRGLPSGVAANG